MFLGSRVWGLNFMQILHGSGWEFQFLPYTTWIYLGLRVQGLHAGLRFEDMLGYDHQ